MISLLMTQMSSHTASVADLVQQVADRGERGLGEVLEHCNNIISNVAEKILERQQTDMDRLRQDLTRISTDTSLEIQRQGVELQKWVESTVTDAVKRLDDSVTQQGVQMLGRCQQMLFPKGLAARLEGRNTGGGIASVPASRPPGSADFGGGVPTSVVRSSPVSVVGASVGSAAGLLPTSVGPPVWNIAGSPPINSDLAHFRVCAEFNKWTEDEKRSWLKWSLKDRAR